MDREAMRLIGSREAARVLGIDNKGIYKLWYSNQLDFWCINGTMRTNLTAIKAYLERSGRTEMEAPTEH